MQNATDCCNNNKKYLSQKGHIIFCCVDKILFGGSLTATISHAIQDLLKRQVLMQEAITHEIVSYNKLAKILKPQIEEELGKKVKHSAVVMALRRSSDKLQKNSRKPSFSYAVETIKTDICYILLEESPNLLHKLRDFYSTIDFKKGGILNIIQGNYEVAIITNIRYKENLIDLLHEEKVIDVVDNLISISLTFSGEFLLTPGVIYDISRFLTWEHINIIDMILTKTELSLIIDKKDLMRCYQTLGRFAENRDNGVRILNEEDL